MKMLKPVALACCACFTQALFATEYFVATNGNDSALGTSESTAFRTIQHAVDTVDSGSTITLLPGDHIEGLAEDATYGRSRVHISKYKTFTIRSKPDAEGKYPYRDTTRIVGAWDDGDESTPVGMGENAIRCVAVTSGTGSRFEGITFYRGSQGGTSVGDYNYRQYAGGLFVLGNKKVTAIDCNFIDCQARIGGAIFFNDLNGKKTEGNGCYAVRCLFKNCRSAGRGDAQSGGYAFYCVYDGNGKAVKSDGTTKSTTGRGTIDDASQIINCTFVNNDNNVIGDQKVLTNGVWNCLFVYNSGNAMTTKSGSDKPGYCVYEGGINGAETGCNNVKANVASNTEVWSTWTGDYSLAPNALSLTTASLDKRNLIPEDFRSTDYAGNAVSDETVYCGAVQSVATTGSHGIRFVAGVGGGAWTVDGETFTGTRYFEEAVAGRLFNVKYAPISGCALVRYDIDGKALWPKMDDSVYFYCTNDAVVTARAIATANILWVDKNSSSSKTEGTAANPYKSLNALQNAIKTKANDYVVYVKPGDYNSGANGDVNNGHARFHINGGYSNNLRIKAVEGAATTFITGSTNDDGKVVRCCNVGATKGRVGIQGFTLRQGRTINTNLSTVVNSAGGGALMNVDKKKTAWLLDCIIDDCSATFGLATYGGTVERCIVKNCMNYANGNNCAVFYNSTAISSLVTGCGATNYTAAPVFSGCDVANVTLYGNRMYTKQQSTAITAKIVNSVLAGRISAPTIRWDNEDMSYSLYDKIYEPSLKLGSNCKQERVGTADTVRFKRALMGDYRLKNTSLGVSLGRGELLKSAMDINGEPFAVDSDGNCVVGCFSEIAPPDGAVYMLK